MNMIIDIPYIGNFMVNLTKPAALGLWAILFTCFASEYPAEMLLVLDSMQRA